MCQLALSISRVDTYEDATSANNGQAQYRHKDIVKGVKADWIARLQTGLVKARDQTADKPDRLDVRE